MHVSQQNIQLHCTASVCHADWHILVFNNASNERRYIPVLRLISGCSRQLEVSVVGFPIIFTDPEELMPSSWGLSGALPCLLQTFGLFIPAWKARVLLLRIETFSCGTSGALVSLILLVGVYYMIFTYLPFVPYLLYCKCGPHP